MYYELETKVRLLAEVLNRAFDKVQIFSAEGLLLVEVEATPVFAVKAATATEKLSQLYPEGVEGSGVIVGNYIVPSGTMEQTIALVPSLRALAKV